MNSKLTDNFLEDMNNIIKFDASVFNLHVLNIFIVNLLFDWILAQN